MLARREAERSKRDVNGLHLLIGLMQEGQGAAAKNLQHLGVTEDALRTVRDKNSADQSVNNFDQVLEEAYAEAVRLKHDFIGSEHLLLALLDSADAETIFEQLNIVPSEAKTRLLQLLGF